MYMVLGDVLFLFEVPWGALASYGFRLSSEMFFFSLLKNPRSEDEEGQDDMDKEGKRSTGSIEEGLMLYIRIKAKCRNSRKRARSRKEETSGLGQRR